MTPVKIHRSSQVPLPTIPRSPAPMSATAPIGRSGRPNTAAAHESRQSTPSSSACTLRCASRARLLNLCWVWGCWIGAARSRAGPFPIRRHIVTARVDLHFDPATGMIHLDGAADGAQLRIEDDMLEAELRPDRSHYASVSDQLSTIGDDVWDHASMHTALKSWAAALHADSQWSADLKPATDGEGRPMVSFAPALILRKRTQVGMVRIYEALIDRLSNDDNDVPPGWGSPDRRRRRPR